MNRGIITTLLFMNDLKNLSDVHFFNVPSMCAVTYFSLWGLYALACDPPLSTGICLY